MLKLSILIPSVPARREMALALYDRIAKQAEGLPVEILLLLDNKRRSIGLKRDALVRLAQGEYLTFVDDDDAVADEYVESILDASHGADVVTFDSWCQINGGPQVRVRHGVKLENQQYNPGGFTRRAWHIHAWRREFVLPYSFPDISNGEDWGWCRQFIDKVQTEEHVALPLYFYRYNGGVSEAA